MMMMMMSSANGQPVPMMGHPHHNHSHSHHHNQPQAGYVPTTTTTTPTNNGSGSGGGVNGSMIAVMMGNNNNSNNSQGQQQQSTLSTVAALNYRHQQLQQQQQQQQQYHQMRETNTLDTSHTELNTIAHTSTVAVGSGTGGTTMGTSGKNTGNNSGNNGSMMGHVVNSSVGATGDHHHNVVHVQQQTPQQQQQMVQQQQELQAKAKQAQQLSQQQQQQQQQQALVQQQQQTQQTSLPQQQQHNTSRISSETPVGSPSQDDGTKTLPDCTPINSSNPSSTIRDMVESMTEEQCRQLLLDLAMKNASIASQMQHELDQPISIPQHLDSVSLLISWYTRSQKPALSSKNKVNILVTLIKNLCENHSEYELQEEDESETTQWNSIDAPCTNRQFPRLVLDSLYNTLGYCDPSSINTFGTKVKWSDIETHVQACQIVLAKLGIQVQDITGKICQRLSDMRQSCLKRPRSAMDNNSKSVRSDNDDDEDDGEEEGEDTVQSSQDGGGANSGDDGHASNHIDLHTSKEEEEEEDEEPPTSRIKLDLFPPVQQSSRLMIEDEPFEFDYLLNI